MEGHTRFMREWKQTLTPFQAFPQLNFCQTVLSLINVHRHSVTSISGSYTLVTGHAAADLDNVLIHDLASSMI